MLHKCTGEKLLVPLYIQVQPKRKSNKTPQKLWYGYTPNVSYFRIFGSRCYILEDDRNGKFDSKGDEGILLGYSTKRKGYKCLNKATNKMIESANVRVDEFAEKKMKKAKKDQKTMVDLFTLRNQTLYLSNSVVLPRNRVMLPRKSLQTENQQTITDEDHDHALSGEHIE